MHEAWRSNQTSIITTSRYDTAFIAKSLGAIARAKGMSQVALDSSLSRESLYKALSGERSPDFNTILKVIAALGLRLHAGAVQEPDLAIKNDGNDILPPCRQFGLR